MLVAAGETAPKQATSRGRKKRNALNPLSIDVVRNNVHHKSSPADDSAEIYLRTARTNGRKSQTRGLEEWCATMSPNEAPPLATAKK